MEGLTGVELAASMHAHRPAPSLLSTTTAAARSPRQQCAVSHRPGGAHHSRLSILSEGSSAVKALKMLSFPPAGFTPTASASPASPGDVSRVELGLLAVFRSTSCGVEQGERAGRQAGLSGMRILGHSAAQRSAAQRSAAAQQPLSSNRLACKQAAPGELLGSSAPPRPAPTVKRAWLPVAKKASEGRRWATQLCPATVSKYLQIQQRDGRQRWVRKQA